MIASALVSFLILIVLVGVTLIFLNLGGTGYLKGMVKDMNGAPIWGAYILVTKETVGLNITSLFTQVLDNTASLHGNFSLFNSSNLTYSDLDGYYEIRIPQSGTYSVIAAVANPINASQISLIYQTSVYLQTDRNKTFDLILQHP